MALMQKWLLAFLTLTGVVTSVQAEVLVFGGTGRLGAPIVELLVEAGHTVAVFARPTSDRSRLEGIPVTYVVGDLMDGNSVSTALRNKQFQLVIDATSRGSSRESFYDTAMENILQAISGSGVQQFILHGSVGAGENMQQFPQINFDRMRDVMIAKGKAEDLLKASGIGYTIIRNGRVERDGTPATGTARLSEDQSLLGTATRLDLAALTMQCLDNPDCMNKTFHAVDDSF